MRRFLLVAPWAVLLMGAGPCEDDPPPMTNDGGADAGALTDGPVSDATTDTTPDASRADGAQAQPEGGADSGNCLDKFEPLSTAAQHFLGFWLVDDKSNNSVCPNGSVLKIVGWGEQGVPFPDPEAGACRPPGELLLVEPFDIKDCSDVAICGSHSSGQVFYVHAGPKDYRGGGYNEAIWVVQDNDAHELGDLTILLYPDHPDQLTYGSKPYTRVPDMLDGRCKEPVR